RGQPVGRGPDEQAEASDHPVVMVTWEDAVAFCAWLSQKEGRSYRLASDHEWSSAAGIGDRENPEKSPREKNLKIPDVFPWGGGFSPGEIQGNYSDKTARAAFGERWDIIDSYDDGFATTAPVGSFEPNTLGIYDLGGNVWEWCADNYGRGGMKTLRGSSWFTFNAEGANTSYRIFGASRYRWNYVGFRIVEVVEDPIEHTSISRGVSKDPALAFNGQFDSVTIDGLEYDGSHPLTLEAWFRTKDRFREQAIITNAEYAGTGILVSKGRIQFHAHLGGGYVTSSVQFTKVNELVHVAGVYDGEEVRLYLDGILQGVPTKSSEKFRQSNQPFVIGANPERFAPDKKGHFIKHFWGMIDEVRVSSTARYTADFEPAKRHRADAATMSLYHFDEGSGTVATDSSGNGHNGKISGAWWVGREEDPPVKRRR
ncbi:MAG: SUMF1/EgtB/PvdO family nonheme iron enzyme, partial [Verrucomicrobiales bacterium]